jgi:hypothetical protein
VALLFSVPSAHASTYLFSFTTTQLLGALSAPGGDANFSEDGYYSILLQPTTLTGYAAVQENSPKPTGADDWQATTQTDNPFIGSGTWIEFAKLDVQTFVTLVSGANGAPGGQNIFLYGGPHTYSDSGLYPPLTFGTGTITSIMAPGAMFSFMLDIPFDPGSVEFTGQASAIWSANSYSYDPIKSVAGIPFTLDLTDTLVTPEPGTWVLLLAGAACVLAAGMFKKKTPAASSRA